ncbi:MAG: DUF2203 domain-containing protein [Aigarchaeota archaeon]|nr:DUF2203 domain-containing protein [Candidatus Pelearchaeum maunauluense]
MQQAQQLIPFIESRIIKLREKVAIAQREPYEASDSLRAEINKILKEIEETGCILRDVGTGIVDFPAIRLGRIVNLCWRMGEKRIRYWHAVDEGYFYRKLIKPEEFYDEEQILQYVITSREPLIEIDETEETKHIIVETRGVPEEEVKVQHNVGSVEVSWNWSGWSFARSFRIDKDAIVSVVKNNGIVEVTISKNQQPRLSREGRA